MLSGFKLYPRWVPLICVVSVYNCSCLQRISNSCEILSKKAHRLKGAFYGCEKVEKTLWFCDLFIF